MVRLYTRGPGGKFVPLGYFCSRCKRIAFDDGKEYRAVPMSKGQGRTCRECGFFLEAGEDRNDGPICSWKNDFTNGDSPAGECEQFDLSILVVEQERS
jgi:DNA-directed RNA polymerase subunit RPC12/RpoP